MMHRTLTVLLLYFSPKCLDNTCTDKRNRHLSKLSLTNTLYTGKFFPQFYFHLFPLLMVSKFKAGERIVDKELLCEKGRSQIQNWLN